MGSSARSGIPSHTALQYSPKEAFELLMLLDFLTIMLAAAAPLKNATLT
jgi:hypothetical protein